MSGINFEENCFLFNCEGEQLLGILAAPSRPTVLGVLIVVGGPQYRVGSHRQFVHLARHLARSGIPTLRFDYRGMGDSSGAMRSFEDIAFDIRAAIDTFLAKAPKLRSIVLWGLCDGASAACLYAPTDARVSGVVLVNPWVRTAAGQARTQLRHYYSARVLDPAFWRKLARGQVDLTEAFCSIGRAIRAAVALRMSSPAANAEGHPNELGPLPERMARGLEGFAGRIMVILSGNDYTAKEFELVWGSSKTWARVLQAAHREDLLESDHTFSTHAAKQRVAESTATWVIQDCQEVRV